MMLFLVTAIKCVLRVQRQAACRFKTCSVKSLGGPAAVSSSGIPDSSNQALPGHEETHLGKQPVGFFVFGVYLPLFVLPAECQKCQE